MERRQTPPEFHKNAGERSRLRLTYLSPPLWEFPHAGRLYAGTRPLRSDSTPAADLIESVFEVATEDFVFRIRGGVRPSGAKASHQSGNPIGRLECLIALAFEVERGLDETPTAVLLGIHAARGGADGGRLYSRAGSSSPLSPCANAHRRIGKDHSADECPDAFVIDV